MTGLGWLNWAVTAVSVSGALYVCVLVWRARRNAADAAARMVVLEHLLLERAEALSTALSRVFATAREARVDEKGLPAPALTDRAARPGEVCGCGRPAVVVLVRADGAELPWCRTQQG